MYQLFRKKSIEHIQAELESQEKLSEGLSKNLGVRDLVALGIAAIVGAGIFGTIGEASVAGGPAVSLLFIFTAVACIFSALCYAEFASTIPISGSAYTYAYASFGELIAWIIGWALLMEYAVGNIAVAISWSDYFTGFLGGLNIHIPEYLTMDYITASRYFDGVLQEVNAYLAQGKALDIILSEELSAKDSEIYLSWTKAPEIFGYKLILDVPAFVTVALVTTLVYIGIKESKNVSNFLVVLKLLVILLVIAVGAFYINPGNWSPFAPNGLSGVLQGVGAVFFAYIGFDAVSTTAEECKNPQRDLPRAMILSVIICTVLYVAIALILTGMVNYQELGVGDPLAFVFEERGLNFVSGVVAISAIFAMTSVLLVFQLGQPRIWMTMSRDGLLPPRFSRLHPRFKTPSFSTILTGVLVGVPALFMNLEEVTNLTSIGTLFAFMLVCGGVLMIQNQGNRQGRFKVPYYNGRFIVPALLILTLTMVVFTNRSALEDFISFSNTNRVADLKKSLQNEQQSFVILEKQYNAQGTFSEQELRKQKLLKEKYKKAQGSLADLQAELEAQQQKTTFAIFLENLPLWAFWLAFVIMAFVSFQKSLSAIPVIGLIINFYLMSQLSLTIWGWFLGTMLVGLVVYFAYGIRKSKLALSK